MGALTLKPSAYVSRPWETTELVVFNHLDGVGDLRFHRRGGRVVSITSPGWLTDVTRFSYDGHRRQRLVTPVVDGRPVSWPVGITRWWDYLAGSNRFEFEVDSSTGSYFFWFFRVYAALDDRRGRPTPVSFDGGTSRPAVYHGAFGLAGVTAADLALPACLPHEEEGHLRHPTGAVTLFAAAAGVFQLPRPARGYRWNDFVSATEVYPRRRGRALLQVSPLQRVLAGW